MAWATGPGAGKDAVRHMDGLAQVPSKLLVVEPNGDSHLRETASIDVEVLAGWLNEARPKDHESAFSMLLMAKDMIRRLVGQDLVLWNRGEMEARRRGAEEAEKLRQESEKLAKAEAKLIEVEEAYKKRLKDVNEKLKVSKNNLFEAQHKLKYDTLKMEERTR